MGSAYPSPDEPRNPRVVMVPRYRIARDRSNSTSGRSGGLHPHIGLLEVLMDGLLWDPEGPAHPDRRQMTAVHQSVHGHLGHSHHRGDFRHGQKVDLIERSLASSHVTP